MIIQRTDFRNSKTNDSYFVNAAYVAGFQPAILGEQFVCFFFLFVVACENARTLYADLAGSRLFCVVHLRNVDQFVFETAEWHSDVSWFKSK